jgi:hypothetical protein
MSIRVTRFRMWFAAMAGVLCACGPNGAATPAPSHGPAFEMIVLRQVPCASDVSATTCLRFESPTGAIEPRRILQTEGDRSEHER